MNSPKKSFKKRELLTGLVSEMTQTLRGRQDQALQSIKEILEKQGSSGLAQPLAPLNKSQALEILEQLQERISPQFCPDLSAQSPWFGSEEKRLRGLGSASLFIPVSAASLAKKHQPFTVQQQLARVSQHTDLLKEQLQRKIDRLTGVRVNVDEWATTFPEDE